MPETALVTGASSGIGRAIARLHAARGGDVVLTARSADELDKLKREIEAEHKVKVHVLPQDIGSTEGVDALCRQIADAGLEVDILVNSAGFGGRGKHTDRELGKELAMIDLNVKSLVALTHHFGRQMAQRGQGRILNLASMAGFMPGPNQAIYFATKAFVKSYSQAVDQELRPRGVTCTALAPGYVETGFAREADLENTKMVKMGGAKPEDVAKVGYDAMMRGKLVAIDRASMSFAANWVIPLLPRRLVLKLAERTQSE